MSYSLTQVATAAAQWLTVLDSGEALSSQQITDCLAIANDLLANWTNEQTMAVQILINEQSKALQLLIDKMSREAAPLVTRQAKDGSVTLSEQNLFASPLATAFTLSGGTYTEGTFTPPTYTAASFTAPTFTGSSVPQFVDATTALTLPAGVARALKTAMGIEIAGWFGVTPSASLVADAKEARAAAFPVPNRVPIPGTAGQALVQPPGVPANAPTPPAEGVE